MKAIVVREYGEPEVMKVEEVDLPRPSGQQVLVRIHAAGVNPVDTYLRTGIHAHAPELPYTPGKDAAGVVEDVGEDVVGFAPGDRVYTAGSITGTYAEFSLCLDSQLGHLPEGVSFEEGACIWTPYATSFRALFQKAGAKAGETVLIHGASGGVGLAAIQWAVAEGLNVIGTASSEEGRDLVKRKGASAVFDHSDPDHFADVRAAADGRGVDIIIEMLANQNLERDFEAIAKFGRIVVVGNRGSLQFTPRQAMTNETTIYGMSLFNASAEDLAAIHLRIADGFVRGFIRPEIGAVFPLAEAPRAHHHIIESAAAGKIVLTM